MALSTIALCQDCSDGISAIEIVATNQAKRCTVCLRVWIRHREKLREPRNFRYFGQEPERGEPNGQHAH